MKNELSLLTRFCAVGLSNTMIDFVIFFIFVYIGFSVFVSQTVAFSAGMFNSFLWNRLWTFKVCNPVTMIEVLRFITINLLALATTYSLLILFIEGNQSSLHFSKILASGGGIFVTFIGSKLWVFKKEVQRQELKEG
jgi:putative flippase GtrA